MGKISQERLSSREGYKVCVDCKLEKPLDDFYKSNFSYDKREYVCKVCKNIRSAEYKHKARAANPEAFRERHNIANNNHYKNNPGRKRQQNLWSIYRMTVEEYNALLNKQGGCAICGTDIPGLTEFFAIDHDHKCCPGRKSCGKCIRGLLCHKCNRGLGNFNDDTNTLQRAIEYLMLGQT